jgi:hypothetical protein
MLNGHAIQLDIYKMYEAVEYAPPAMEIGRVLQGLSLDVQGEQDDIITPIVKTSLSMTFADAPGEQPGKKTGDWEEFYTPDSLAFKVELRKDGTLIWSGYITPDSFEEDLEYRGSVTLVARDNIGHLQDFQFDATSDNDMISVKDIIAQAWAKVQCLMSVWYSETEDIIWPECEGVTALDCLVNLEAFDGKTWYEALEGVLNSFGLAIRYVGKNECRVMPIRAIPCLSKETLEEVEVKDVVFEATAHRMLTPACKSIVDTVNYDQGPIAEFNLDKEDYNRVTLAINGSEVETWEPRPSSGWERNGNIGTINPFEFAADPRSGSSYADNSNLFVSVVNEVDPFDYIFTKKVFMVGEQVLDISFTINGIFYSANYNGTSINAGSAKQQAVSLNYALKAYICDDQANVCGTRYFDPDTNTFVSEEKYCVATVSYGQTADRARYGQQSLDVQHSVVVPAGTGIFEVIFYGFTATVSESGAAMRPSYTPIQNMIDAGKAYCKISNFLMEQSEAQSYRYSKLTTVYDESYNMMITRDPMLGSAPLVLTPKVIVNGIYLPDSFYSSARVWKWPGGEDSSLQAVIAQQILMYYSQPNSVITGTLLASRPNEILGFDCLWRWRNKKLVLLAGQLNLLTGHIENAKLREYKDWVEMWPNEGYLINERATAYITSEDGNKVVVGTKTFQI